MIYKNGFVAGAFDMLHAGHVLLLEQCKKHCKKLIIGLHTDPSIDRLYKNKPIQSSYERYVQLKGCKYVDEIIPYDTEKDLENILSSQDINIRFLGDDYLTKHITAHNICEIRNIKLFFIPRLHDYSSSELRKRIIKENK